MTSERARAVIFCTDGGLFFQSILSADEAASLARAGEYTVMVIVERGCVPAGFAEWHAKRGSPFEVIEMDMSDLPRGNLRLPTPATLRLYLASLFKDRFDRILYVDGDTEIRGEIAPLFDLDMNGYAFAAVDDLGQSSFDEAGAVKDCRTMKLRREAGLDPSVPGLRYAQSGVLLIDTDKWISDGIASAAVDVFKQWPDMCFYFDQDMLNVAVSGRFCIISPVWNFCPRFMQGVSLWTEPAIIHFAGDEKPWYAPTWRGSPAHTKRYRRYFAKTPWRREPRPAPWQALPRSKEWGLLAENALRRLRRAVNPRTQVVSDSKNFRPYFRNTRFADVEQGLVPPYVPDVLQDKRSSA